MGIGGSLGGGVILQSTGHAPHDSEDWLPRGLPQQLPRGLVQRYDAVNIRREVAGQLLGLDVSDGGPGVGDAGIRDHDVETVDPLGCERIHGSGGVVPDVRVHLDHDQFAAGRLGEVKQRLRGRVIRVAVRRNHGVVRLLQVPREEPLAEAAVRAAD